MRFETMTGAMVLAAGLVWGGVAVAAPASQNPATDTPSPTVVKKTPVRAAPPTPVALGPEHKILGGFVGRWKTTTRMMQSASQSAAQDNEGTADGKLLMGGRFAQLVLAGKADGQPFEGMMLCGFDQVVQKYTASWLDNASTAIIHYVGTYDASKKQLTMSSHYSDQKTRKLTLSTIVLTFVDADTIALDEFVAHAVGEKESHTMSVTLKRSAS